MNDEAMKKNAPPTLGIIVPCFNERDVIELTMQSLLSVLGDLIGKGKITPASFVAFVDDGSVDRTWEAISGAAKSARQVRALKLSANRGHQFALLAGIDMYSPAADVIVSIDADLQDDVAAIERMVDEYRRGNDVVYGVRRRRSTDSFFKRNTALFFYHLMRILGVGIVSNHADFRLMSRRACQALSRFTEENLFLRGIVPMLGFTHSVVYYDRKVRAAGSTKYPIFKMLSFAWEGITSFSVAPLRLVTIAGFALFVLSIGGALFAVFSRLFLSVVPGWESIVLPMYLLGGIQLLALGIIGEYLGKVYREVKRRPRYIVEDIVE